MFHMGTTYSNTTLSANRIFLPVLFGSQCAHGRLLHHGRLVFRKQTVRDLQTKVGGGPLNLSGQF